MSREEVQINDLEPSIIGEDVTRHAIQIRGVDGNGNEGPWSTILVYESPELLPSLQSNNYVPDQSGWLLDNDGTFEVNDGFIRGTLQSSNYVSGVSGWALDQNGVVEFQDGEFRGALRIGTNTFNVDSNGNMFIGGSTFNNSPFAVNTSGQIVSASLTTSMITSGTFAAVRIPNLEASKITSGTFDPVLIPNLSADKITTGTLNANNVTISGQLSSVTLAIGSGSNSFRIDSSGNISLGGTNFNNAVFTVSNTGNVVSTGRIDVEGGGRLGAALGIITDLSVDFIEVVERSVIPRVFNFDISGTLVVGGLSTYNGTLRNPGMTTAATGANVIVAGTQFVFRRESSSIRYKKNIRTADRVTNLLEVRPVYFDPKDQEEDETPQKDIYGAIAEEFDDLGLNSLVQYNEKNQPESIRYSHIGLALIPYVKELYDRMEELERRLDGS